MSWLPSASVAARVAARSWARAPASRHALIRASAARCCSRKAAEEAARHAIAAAERASGELTAAERAAAVKHEWTPSSSKEEEESATAGGEPAAQVDRKRPRFPLGALVECRLGPDRWAVGKVVGHHYREPSWPAERRAPYQVQLEGAEAPLIYAPADVDECVRSTLRFEVGAEVECFLDDSWVKGTVTSQYHHEPSWPPDQWAPYQVELVNDGSHGQGKNVRIYAPVDNDLCIRAPASWPWPGAAKP